jgi:hypothetical protein
MVRPQQAEQVFQEVRARDSQPGFHEERLEELLGGLLAAETNKIIYGRSASSELSRDAMIDFGLAEPIRR